MLYILLFHQYRIQFIYEVRIVIIIDWKLKKKLNVLTQIYKELIVSFIFNNELQNKI